MTSQSSISSINVPTVIEWRAEAEQFLLNKCLTQSAEPDIYRESRELCLECASTTYFTRRAVRSTSSWVVGKDGGAKEWARVPFKGMKWKDGEEKLRDVTDTEGMECPSPDSRARAKVTGRKIWRFGTSMNQALWELAIETRESEEGEDVPKTTDAGFEDGDSFHLPLKVDNVPMKEGRRVASYATSRS